MSQSYPRRITVLGATGSVGTSTLSLIEENPGKYEVEALTANRDVQSLAVIARRVGAKVAVVADKSQYATLKAALSGSGIEVAAGDEAVVEAAGRPADLVMAPPACTQPWRLVLQAPLWLSPIRNAWSVPVR